MKLINDLLDVAKMEAGQIQVVIEKAPLEPVLMRAIDSVRVFADNHDVRLELKEVPDIFVYVDADRLVQVIINLVSNAVKFSPAGETVTICVEEQGEHFELKVTDRGRGIPADKIESIFERFTQVELSDARKKGGTGLGLEISRSIIERHNGQIGVVSRPGEGSTFWFRIPKKSLASSVSV